MAPEIGGGLMTFALRMQANSKMSTIIRTYKNKHTNQQQQIIITV